jgi:hypothetical protein
MSDDDLTRLSKRVSTITRDMEDARTHIKEITRIKKWMECTPREVMLCSGGNFYLSRTAQLYVELALQTAMDDMLKRVHDIIEG